jgi:signal transduction histidine kinase/CheY-like chemotaxis protein/PAS domain-containing protein
VNYPGLFDASPNPYLVLDRRLFIVGANRAYLASVKRELSDIVGRWAWDAFPADPETVRQSVASFERVIRTGQPDTMALLRFDVPRPEAEGGGFAERYWSITHTPVPGPGGEVEFVLQHPIDVTELQHLRAEVERGGAASPVDLTPTHSGIFSRARSVYESNLTLKAESDRLNEMFAAAPGFMVLLRGREHRIELANPAYMRLVGQRPIIGRTVAEALPDAVEGGYLGLLDRVFDSGEAYVASGSRFAMQASPDAPADERFVDFVFQPLKDREGRVTGIFVEGVDVTERVRAEARREALVRLTDAIRDLHDPVELAHAAATMLGETIDVSRVGYGTIDLDKETLIVERDWTAPGVGTLAGTLRLRDYGSVLDTLKTGEFFSTADVTRDPRVSDGAAALIARSARSFVNMPVTEGGRTVAVFFVNHAEARDWSPEDLALIREFAERTRTAVERLRAEAALRELNASLERRVAERTAERDLLATLVETTDVMVKALALDHTVLAINRANADEFERIYGIRPKAGDNLLDLLAGQPEHQAQVRAGWARGLAGEESTFVGEFGDPAMARRYYENKFRILRDRRGERIGAYLFVTDVTERLREQHALAEAQAQLQQAQKMEAIGQLTGGLAHDVNNMLQGIGGALQLMEKRIAAGQFEELSRLFRGAREGVDRAAALTHGLLAFARRGQLDPKPVVVDEVVRGMADLVGRTVGPGIEVRLSLNDGQWTTNLDPNRLESALLNLAINARDAMPEGGHLTFSTREVALSAAELAGEAGTVTPGDFVLLSVADSGHGMPPDVLARVFEPFFTTKPIGRGTGLGLSQLYGFVRQSGGLVRIESDIGRGTIVHVYLPRSDATLVAADPAAPRDAPADASGGIVLLVDDEPAVRATAAEALRDRGYTVLEAADGPSGLAALAGADRVDILVTDVGLPGLNGRQVADAARERRPLLPVLFITGYAGTALDHGLPPGMAAIGKPFSLDDLAERVAAMLTAHRG